jgi:hypothetical protein
VRHRHDEHHGDNRRDDCKHCRPPASRPTIASWHGQAAILPDLNRDLRNGGLLLGGALAIGALAGCGHSTQGSAVSVPRIERELTAVVYREKLAQGYTFHISTRCDPSSNDLLHFVCAVTASGGSKPFTFNVNVTCDPPGTVNGQRCESDSGDMLD